MFSHLEYFSQKLLEYFLTMGITSPGFKQDLERFLTEKHRQPLVFKFFTYANITRYVHKSAVPTFDYYHNTLLPILKNNYDRVHQQRSHSIFERNSQLATMNAAVTRNACIGSCIDMCHSIVAHMLQEKIHQYVIPFIISLTIKKGEGMTEFNANHCMVGLIDPSYYQGFFHTVQTGSYLKKNRTDTLTVPLALQKYWVYVVDPSLRQHYRIDSEWIARIEANWPDFDAECIDQVWINYVYFISTT